MSISTKTVNKTEGLSFRKVDNEGIIYNPNTGRLHVLNHTGLFYWELLEHITDIQEIARSFAMQYDQDEQQIKESLDSFIEDLQKQGLLNVRDI